jgi:hypothetical protein
MLRDLEATEAVVLKARCPEEVFGPLAGDKAVALRRVYHRVIGTVHPDKFPSEPAARARAQTLVGQLAEWRVRAEEKITAGTYGDNKRHEPAQGVREPQTIKAPKHTYVVTERFAQGDLADLYHCSYVENGTDNHAVFKIAQSAADNDLLENEQKVLLGMYPLSQKPELMYRFLPKPYESFVLKGERGVGNRRVNVLQLARDYVSLAEVRDAYPSGLDFRHAAWVFNRGLEVLWYVHKHHKTVHGAVLPTHLLVHPDRHGGKIVDWCYAVPEGGFIGAISKEYRSFYAPEVLKKERATSQTDIYMLAKCMVALLGGDLATHTLPPAVPKPIGAFLQGCLIESASQRPDDAGALREEFDEVLARVVGPRHYHGPLVMPAKT